MVSTRTIYRDVDALSLSGIPVYTNRGKGGGISLLPDYVLSKSLLNEQEQNEILSALQGLSAVKTTETDQILEKLGALFNHGITPWVNVDFSDWSNSNREIFSLCKAAILEKRVIEFQYYNANGEKTARRVEPLQLRFKSKSWYLYAFCLTKNDERLFKLTRIKNISLSNEMFSESSLKNANTDIPRHTRGRGIVTLKLKIAPEMTYRVYDEFDECAIVKNNDGSHTVSVVWPEDEWVYGTILSFGHYIEVIEPEYMRVIIRDRLRQAAGKYS